MSGKTGEEENGPDNIKNIQPLQEPKKSKRWKKKVRKHSSKKKLLNLQQEENLSTDKSHPSTSTSGSTQISKSSTQKLLNENFSQSRAHVEESTDSEDNNAKRLMSYKHKSSLQKNRLELVENMLPEEIFNVLLSKKVLTTYEVNQIKEGGIRESMNEKLIDILMCKSDKAFFVFVAALNKYQQRHLANLLKRKQGDIRVIVDIEDIIHSRGKETENEQMCQCEEMYDELVQMAMSGYRNIRRKNSSPAAYEQYSKELHGTNSKIKESFQMWNMIKKLCRHGRRFICMTNGSICFYLNCSTMEGLEDLWQQYTSGKLLTLLQRGLITTLKQKFHLKMVKLRVRIIEEEFQQCRRELSSPFFGRSEDISVKESDLQPLILSEMQRILPPNFSPKSRAPLKDIYQNIPVSRIKERISSKSKKVLARKIGSGHLYSSNPMQIHKKLL